MTPLTASVAPMPTRTTRREMVFIAVSALQREGLLALGVADLTDAQGVVQFCGQRDRFGPRAVVGVGQRVAVVVPL